MNGQEQHERRKQRLKIYCRKDPNPNPRFEENKYELFLPTNTGFLANAETEEVAIDRAIDFIEHVLFVLKDMKEEL
jgi:hypothetical protein